MSSLDAFAHLRRLGVPVIETGDAAAALRQSASATTRTLKRLAHAGLVTPVRQGVWWLEGKPDPYRLVEYLTAPLPSYLSLQTALHLRGAIEQIPEVFYAVSLARTERLVTRLGTFSVHHVLPELFSGFERTPEGLLLATVEKALFDLAYLSGGRGRLFTSLPELELPRRFRVGDLERWLERISAASRRALVKRRLRELLEKTELRSALPRWLR